MEARFARTKRSSALASGLAFFILKKILASPYNFQKLNLHALKMTKLGALREYGVESETVVSFGKTKFRICTYESLNLCALNVSKI